MTEEDFCLLNSQLRAMLVGESDSLANASNFVGLLFNALSDVNWLGIYVVRGDQLVLGPFQGKPACVRIDVGVGVCGTAVANRETQRVADVHAFDGHIVCDPESRAEIVVPLVGKDQVIGVLDIDSPTHNRFSADDQRGIEKLCDTFCKIQAGQSAFI